VRAGDVISYLDMCQAEGINLQQGMNFAARGRTSVILISLRPGAPYADQVQDGGSTLIYEGHDQPRTTSNPNPKALDQVLVTPSGTPTQNGRFYDAAVKHREGKTPAERVRVYEKIRSGIWVHNGTFELLDSWAEQVNGRRVFKFRLKLTSDDIPQQEGEAPEIEQQRVIPTAVKLAVWKRDSGRCTQCGATDNLHFDHIIPYSRGGSSLVVDNVQLLCARHNLSKRDKIR